MGIDDEIARGVFHQPLDLEPIKRRLSFAPEKAWYTEDLAQLIEEVERLRAKNKRLNAIVGVP